MAEGGRVSVLELFFDLVFVFAFTQVTALMARGTGGDVTRGLLVLALLWWCWCCFAWLGNTVRADEGVTRLALFGVMATMFVIALTIPEAFHDEGAGLSAPLLFVGCYVIVRVLHLVMYWYAGRGDAALRRQVALAGLPMVVGASMLLAAAYANTLTERTFLWAAALALDYLGIYLTGSRGWRVNSAVHFAERHGLIIIVALGESIVSIGVGVSNDPVTWPIIAASTLGIAIAAALWWAYFDVTALAVEQVLHRTRGAARAALARDAYTYLHFPMIAGIILLSLGLKKSLEYAGPGHHLDDPLKGLGLYALYGGVIIYLLGHLGFKLRALGRLSYPRLVAVVLLAVLIPAAAKLPALVSLALLTVVCVGLVLLEYVRYAEVRVVVRTQEHDDSDHEHDPAR